MEKFLQMIGLMPSERDKQIRALVNNSYKSVRVVGRGTIKIDPEEVRNTADFKRAQERASQIVQSR